MSKFYFFKFKNVYIIQFICQGIRQGIISKRGDIK